MKKLLARGTLCAIGLLVLSACGERPQVIEYKQGTYQGKTDTHPYDSAPWNGDKAKWESDIRARGQMQNDYKRMP